MLKTNLKVAAVLAGGLMLGLAGATALQTQAQTKTTTTVAKQDTDTILIRVESEDKVKHWTEEPLIALAAESSLEQSIYLSAVQLVKLERTRGNVRDAIPALENLATKVPKQPLRSAIRRLIVDIELESNDQRGFKEAEKNLQTIISESLVQF